MYENALVVGLGVSGDAAARLLLNEGTSVTVVDAASSDGLLARAAALEGLGARVMLGTTVLPAGSYDVAIISPGVAHDAPLYQCARQSAALIIGELELGATRCRCRLLAITGTNGKSTLVTFCAAVLTAAGCRVAVAGNIGIPLCAVVGASDQLDWIVVEVSSFQLETVQTFRPDVGVLLNLQPDHLDRHATMAEYAALKARLFARQEAGDVAIVHAPCRPTLRDALPGGLLATVVTFGGNTPADYEYADGVITRRRDAQRISLAGTRFANAILGQSAAAAMAAVDACGRDGRVVEAVATDFAGLPHRMVDLGMIKGVRFINDSKATNLSALAAALQMVNGPVRLIAGGRLKENNLESIQEILAKQASAVYLVGEAAGLMAAAWRDTVTCHPVGTLQAAVRAAWNDACVGESILLSPGCASFDQFNGYAHRGDVFTNLVMRLVEEQ